MLGKIFKKFKKGGNESDEPEKKLPKKLKLNPNDYYPVMFGNIELDNLPAKEKSKKFFKSIPFKKTSESNQADVTSENLPENAAERHQFASKLLKKAKRHYRVEHFRSHWKKMKITPGFVDRSRVAVYGQIQISEEKEYPFYVVRGEIGLSCKMPETPTFTEGRVTALGHLHTDMGEHPRLYLETEILYLHKDDFQ